MKNSFFLCLFFILINSASCLSDTKLQIPSNSLINYKDNDILKKVSFEKYLSKDTLYLLIFSDTECTICQMELEKMINMHEKYKFLHPILVLNNSFPDVYLIHASKSKIFTPMVLNKDYELLDKNKLSRNTKYLVIDHEQNILCKSRSINDKKIKLLLNK